MRGGLIRRASVASGSRHCCRMRRERLIRPTEGAGICRPDKTRKRRIRHQASGTVAGCGVNALSGLRRVREFVGLIRRASVASGIWHRCRMRRERLIRLTDHNTISSFSRTQISVSSDQNRRFCNRCYDRLQPGGCFSLWCQFSASKSYLSPSDL